jgi:hypothetical protein
MSQAIFFDTSLITANLFLLVVVCVVYVCVCVSALIFRGLTTNSKQTVQTPESGLRGIISLIVQSVVYYHLCSIYLDEELRKD